MSDIEHPFISAEAKYYALRKSKDGIIVSFVLHPSDLVTQLTTAPIGTRMLLAVAEIQDEETQPTEGAENGRQ